MRSKKKFKRPGRPKPGDIFTSQARPVIKHLLANVFGGPGRKAVEGVDHGREPAHASSYPVPEQIQWIEKELKASSNDWKIVFFHHPLYSSGHRHGSDLRLREVLEPLFLKYNVSLVLNGHDHFYERIKPQKGIAYFVVGSGGQLRAGNIDRGTGLSAKGFDTDLAFMAAEIVGDEMYFNVISRLGQIVDSGMLKRRKVTP